MHGSKDHASSTQRSSVHREGKHYRKQYETDVQEVFSHTHHHWHSRGEDGSRVPHPYCRKKGGRRKTAQKKNVDVVKYASKIFRRLNNGATPRKSSALASLDNTVCK